MMREFRVILKSDKLRKVDQVDLLDIILSTVPPFNGFEPMDLLPIQLRTQPKDLERPKWEQLVEVVEVKKVDCKLVVAKRETLTGKGGAGGRIKRREKRARVEDGSDESEQQEEKNNWSKVVASKSRLIEMHAF